MVILQSKWKAQFGDSGAHPEKIESDQIYPQMISTTSRAQIFVVCTTGYMCMTVGLVIHPSQYENKF